MAEQLKNFFSGALVKRLAASIAEVWPELDERAFVRDATRGLDALELLARADHITTALRRHLPDSYERAIEVLLRSLGPEHATDELLGVGMDPFFYLPHTMYVARFGLDHFELSMRAQHVLTRRFSCEFSVRAFLERYPERTLAELLRFAADPSPHVRRLASEGTRPRLPWASRVRWIEREPETLMPILEALKDDPSSLVRRSVANHLNDLAKSRPELVLAVCARWIEVESRRPLIEHALRTLVKRGDRGALALLGFGGGAKVELLEVRFEPPRVRIGGKTQIAFTLASKRQQELIVDLAVHFVKARGVIGRKVFKVARVSLAKGGEVTLSKSISVAVHTTRKPYPGEHAVDALVNGEVLSLGAFTVLEG